MEPYKQIVIEKYNAIEEALLALVSEGSCIDHLIVSPHEDGSYVVYDPVRRRGYDLSLHFGGDYCQWIGVYFREVT